MRHTGPINTCPRAMPEASTRLRGVVSKERSGQFQQSREHLDLRFSCPGEGKASTFWAEKS